MFCTVVSMHQQYTEVRDVRPKVFVGDPQPAALASTASVQKWARCNLHTGLFCRQLLKLLQNKSSSSCKTSSSQRSSQHPAPGTSYPPTPTCTRYVALAAARYPAGAAAAAAAAAVALTSLLLNVICSSHQQHQATCTGNNTGRLHDGPATQRERIHGRSLLCVKMSSQQKPVALHLLPVCTHMS